MPLVIRARNHSDHTDMKNLFLAFLFAALVCPVLARAAPPVNPSKAQAHVVCDSGCSGSGGTQYASTISLSATITSGSIYQTLQTSNVNRHGCLIQNPPAASEVLNVRVGGTSGAVFVVSAGNSFMCNSPGLVITDQIEVMAITGAHAFSEIFQ